MSRAVTIVALSFGDEREYNRSIFSLWSFYAHLSVQWEKAPALLFTDRAQFFERHLTGLPVTCITLSPSRIKEMRGHIDFVHRMKICAIEEAFSASDENLFYIDGDTFFISDCAALFTEVSETVSFMHTPEYAFHQLRDLPLPSGLPFHLVAEYIERNELIMADGSRCSFGLSLSSWNAGAILLHRSHKTCLPDVFKITDQLYSGTSNHASEQYAFSLVLQTRTQLKHCHQYVFHYWHRIKKRIADMFLLRHLNETWLNATQEEKIAAIGRWTKILPDHFDNHQLTWRDNAIQAFNEGRCREGNFWAIKALMKYPFSIAFLKDFLYHNKRFLLQRHGS